MSARLRHIALTVEAHPHGGYLWLLIESAGQRVFVLERGQRPYSSYVRALQAGFEHLALLSASGLHERGVSYTPQSEVFRPQSTKSIETIDAL